MAGHGDRGLLLAGRLSPGTPCAPSASTTAWPGRDLPTAAGKDAPRVRSPARRTTTRRCPRLRAGRRRRAREHDGAGEWRESRRSKKCLGSDRPLASASGFNGQLQQAVVAHVGPQAGVRRVSQSIVVADQLDVQAVELADQPRGDVDHLLQRLASLLVGHGDGGDDLLVDPARAGRPRAAARANRRSSGAGARA